MERGITQEPERDPTREALRRAYLSDQNADLAMDGLSRILKGYEEEYKRLTPENEIEEVNKLHKRGIRLAEALFAYGEINEDNERSRSIRLPLLGNFCLEQESDDPDRPVYRLTTDTFTGKSKSDEPLAYMHPEDPAIPRVSGAVGFSRLKHSVRVLEGICAEADVKAANPLRLA